MVVDEYVPHSQAKREEEAKGLSVSQRSAPFTLTQQGLGYHFSPEP